MARKPKARVAARSKLLPEFTDTITLECEYGDDAAPAMAWDWWAPLGNRYSVHIETRGLHRAGWLHVIRPDKIMAQVFVLAEAEALPGDRVRFRWVGYAMKGDFLKRAEPMTLEGYHGYALKASDLSPIFHIWRAMTGCRVCGQPMPCGHDDEGWICNHCSAAAKPLEG